MVQPRSDRERSTDSAAAARRPSYTSVDDGSRPSWAGRSTMRSESDAASARPVRREAPRILLESLSPAGTRFLFVLTYALFGLSVWQHRDRAEILSFGPGVVFLQEDIVGSPTPQKSAETDIPRATERRRRSTVGRKSSLDDANPRSSRGGSRRRRGARRKSDEGDRRRRPLIRERRSRG